MTCQTVLTLTAALKPESFKKKNAVQSNFTSGVKKCQIKHNWLCSLKKVYFTCWLSDFICAVLCFSLSHLLIYGFPVVCCYWGIWTELILYSLALNFKTNNMSLNNKNQIFTLFNIFLQLNIRMYFYTGGGPWCDFCPPSLTLKLL